MICPGHKWYMMRCNISYGEKYQKYPLFASIHGTWCTTRTGLIKQGKLWFTLRGFGYFHGIWNIQWPLSYSIVLLTVVDVVRCCIVFFSSCVYCNILGITTTWHQIVVRISWKSSLVTISIEKWIRQNKSWLRTPMMMTYQRGEASRT